MSTGFADQGGQPQQPTEPLAGQQTAPPTTTQEAPPASPQPSVSPQTFERPSAEDFDSWFRTPQQIPDQGQQPDQQLPPDRTGQQPTDEGRTFIDVIRSHPLGQLAIQKYGEDEDAIINGFLNATQALSRRDQDAALYRAQALAQAAQGQQYQPAQPKPGDEPRLWDAPEFKPEWLTMIGRDEKGDLTGPQDAVRGLQNFQAWATRRNLELLADPAKTLGPLFRKDIEAIVDQRTRQVAQHMESQRWAEQQFQQYAPHVYVNGIPENGTTPFGERFLAYGQQALQLNITDPRARLAYIQTAIDRDFKAYQQAVSQQQIEQRQQQVIPQANGRPNAQAAVYTPNTAGPTQTNGNQGLYIDGEDPLVAAMRNLQRAGLKLEPDSRL